MFFKHGFDNYKEIANKAYNQGYLSGFDFSIFMQKALISKHGYVMSTGNYENANTVVAVRLAKNIERHPLLWKLFFMVG